MGTAQQLLIYGAASGSTDPSFGSVVLLCHFDGADGSWTPPLNVVQALGRGNVMSGGATAQLDTAQSLFGGASLWVNNTTTQWAQSATHTDYAFGTGDFTIEFAVRTPTLSADILYDQRPGSNGAYPALSTNSSGDLFYYVSGATRITGSAVLATNTWKRIAVSRVSGTTRMFVEGTQVGSSWSDSTNYLQAAITIGASSISIGQTPWDGWIDEMRITKGVGRYSSNYTVATAAFPDS